MAADLEADTGSDAALPLIEQLRAYDAAEADTILAALRLRQSRIAEASTALQAALIRYRVEPWSLIRYKQKALNLATTIATTDPRTAPAIFDALRERFAVHAVEGTRRIAQIEVASTFDFKGRCLTSLEGLEPYVPWTARFLGMRRDCYQMNGDPRLAAAARDVNDYIAGEPAPIAPR
jgi:hypothetical protein